MSRSRSRMLFRALVVVSGLGLCCLLLLFLLGLLLAPQGSGGGRPVITISHQTTRLTEALGPDGYVDYLGAVNAELSTGVTPENNAAVELLSAMGPGSIGGDMRREYFQRLGIAIPAEQGDYFRPLKDFESIDLHAVAGRTADGSVEAGDGNGSAVDADLLPEEGPASPTLVEEQKLAQQRPWTPKELPRIAAWLTANERPLEHIRAATLRPRWYTPMLSTDGQLMTVLLPQTQDAREAARLLVARAMLRLGQGEPEAAWQDLQACHRLARLVGQGACMVERLVAMAIEQMACGGDYAVALHGNLPASRLLEMQGELANLQPLPPMVEGVDRFERYSFLAVCSKVAREGPLALDEFTDQPMNHVGALERAFNGLVHYAVDWDIPLRMGNEYFDRMAATASESDANVREEQFDELEAELGSASAEAATPPSLTDVWNLRTEMGRRMGQILTSLLAPAVRAAIAAEKQSSATLSLTRLAFALAAYRADTGIYPAQLTDLVPQYLQALPRNLGEVRDVSYERTAEGYQLTWLGPNHRDDQGRGFADQPRGDDVRISVPLSLEK